MGRRHPQGAAMFPDEKGLILFLKCSWIKNEDKTAFHLGPVLPPSGDGSPSRANDLFSHVLDYKIS